MIIRYIYYAADFLKGLNFFLLYYPYKNQALSFSMAQSNEALFSMKEVTNPFGR